MFYHIIALLLLIIAVCIASLFVSEGFAAAAPAAAPAARIFVMYTATATAKKNMAVFCPDEKCKKYFTSLASTIGFSEYKIVANQADANLFCVRCTLDKRDPFFKRMNEDTTIKLFDYEGVDKAKLNFFIPLVQFKFIDFRLYMPKRYELTHLYSCIYEEPVVEKLTMTIDKPIAGINPIVNKYDEFKVIELPHQIRLAKPGDVIILTNQTNQSHDGKWIVASPTLLQSMPMMNFGDSFIELPSNSRDVIKGLSRNKNKTQDMGQVWFSDLDVAGSIKGNIAIVHAKLSDESKHLCVTSPEYLTRETCESEYNAFGEKKTSSDVWDRRCVVNTDCPFYDEKKNRGTCNRESGYCELPLGVRRVGYTRFTGTPYCHGSCDLIPTDYAFAYDDRKPEGYSYADIQELFIPDHEGNAANAANAANAPIHELNDEAFQNTFLNSIGNQFEPDNNNKSKVTKSPAPFFINDSCQALLSQTRLEKLGYVYVFGSVQDVFKNEMDDFYYFTARVCIHAPSKMKGKVIQYDCKMNQTSYYFANVKTLGSIFQSDLVFNPR